MSLIKIRKNVFETNSSSCHTLTYEKCEIKNINEIKPDFSVNTEYTLGKGEYGWGPDKLDYWIDKADYLAIECFPNERWDDKKVPDIYSFDMSKKILLEKVLKMKYPNIKIKYSTEGYIDHQSGGEIWEEILSSDNPEITLYNIIFNDNNFMNIDNDN